MPKSRPAENRKMPFRSTSINLTLVEGQSNAIRVPTYGP